MFSPFLNCKEKFVKSKIVWIKQRDVNADYIESFRLLFYFNSVLFILYFFAHTNLFVTIYFSYFPICYH